LVDVADPVDDWLWAASSALSVSGDIFGPPLNPGSAVELPEGGVAISNGLPAGAEPIGSDDDGLVAVNDLMASNAADAAPKPSSMAELRQLPHRAAPLSME
jgi:hypothetical protein